MQTSTRRAARTPFPRRALGRAALTAAALAAMPRRAWAQSVVADELRVVDGETFYGLDPVHEFSTSYLRGVGACECLTRVTPFGEAEPELAHSYEMVDPYTWRVTLRDGVRFWSGRLLTAQVAYEALERSRALRPRTATLLRGIRIAPVGERTLEFTSDGLIPGLPLLLAEDPLAIYNPASFGPDDNSFDVPAADYTGYFRVTAFEPRVAATLERFDGYWGVRPRMRRVRLQEISDPEARSLVALSGEAHMVRSPSSTAAGQIERSRVARLVGLSGPSTSHMYLNTTKPPFDDVRVRQALAWAVDRDELVSLALDGLGKPLPSWFSSNPAYPEARRTGYTKYDAARAAQLLEEVGWRLPAGGKVRMKNGAPLKFRITWWGNNGPLSEVLQAQWGKLGADISVEGSTDYGFLVARRMEDNWEAFIETQSTFGDPAPIVARHMAPDGVNFYQKLRDPETDRLLAGFDQLLDAEERRQQALKINERHAEIMPFIPLASRDRLVAVSRALRNYTPHFLGTQYDVNPDLWVAS